MYKLHLPEQSTVDSDWLYSSDCLLPGNFAAQYLTDSGWKFVADQISETIHIIGKTNKPKKIKTETYF